MLHQQMELEVMRNVWLLTATADWQQLLHCCFELQVGIF